MHYFPTAMVVYLTQSAYLRLTSSADCVRHIAHTIVHTHVKLISFAVPHHRAVRGYCDVTQHYELALLYGIHE